MKYEAQAKEMLNIIWPKESWMDDEDYQEFIDLILKNMGTNIQGLSDAIQWLSDAIEEGVNNGHSVDVQLDLLKKLKNL